MILQAPPPPPPNPCTYACSDPSTAAANASTASGGEAVIAILLFVTVCLAVGLLLGAVFGDSRPHRRL